MVDASEDNIKREENRKLEDKVDDNEKSEKKKKKSIWI